MKDKILVIAGNNLGIGGIQTVIMSIQRNLINKFIFDIVVFDHLDTYHEQEFSSQGKIFTIPFKTGTGVRKKLDFYVRGLKLYQSLDYIMRNYGPYKAVHCHNFFEAGIALKAAYDNNISIRIAHSHSCVPIPATKFVRHIYNYIYRRLILKYATNLLACSKIAAQYLYGTVADARVLIVPNAIDVKKFTFSDKINANIWSFIQVGRYGNPKNQLFSLEVFANIVKCFPNAKFTLIGEGTKTETAKIKASIVHHHIENNIILLPADEDVPLQLRKNNFMLFPSTFEGLGIVLIEAQSVGLKCFASSAVPREADLGNVRFLDLSLGASRWAEYIIRDVQENGVGRRKVNMSNYDINNIINIYNYIYAGH